MKTVTVFMQKFFYKIRVTLTTYENFVEDGIFKTLTIKFIAL